MSELLDAAIDLIAQFEHIKAYQHGLLDHGLAEAERNWEKATDVAIDFDRLIAAVAALKSRETLNENAKSSELISDPMDYYHVAERWGWTRWNLPPETQG